MCSSTLKSTLGMSSVCSHSTWQSRARSLTRSTHKPLRLVSFKHESGLGQLLSVGQGQHWEAHYVSLCFSSICCSQWDKGLTHGQQYSMDHMESSPKGASKWNPGRIQGTLYVYFLPSLVSSLINLPQPLELPATLVLFSFGGTCSLLQWNIPACL